MKSLWVKVGYRKKSLVDIQKGGKIFCQDPLLKFFFLNGKFRQVFDDTDGFISTSHITKPITRINCKN